MQKVSVVIPTRNRYGKLLKCLQSIPREEWIETIVICDDDPASYASLNNSDIDKYMNIKTFLTHTRLGAVAARNKYACVVKDGLLYATDDIEFMPNCIEKAFEVFNKSFPDDDGVVGIAQDQQHHPTGVALLGTKFLDRYPGRQPFYPGYDHFACQEVHWLATKIGKFVIAEEAVVKHYHPLFYKELHDTTHDEARQKRQQDHELITQRQQKNLIWGFNNEQYSVA